MRAALVLLIAVGTALRAFRLGWGLPTYVFPDAAVHFIRPAMQAAAGGGVAADPEFVHPPVLVVVLAAAFRLWGALTGQPIHARGPLAIAQMPDVVLVGRLVMVAASVSSLLVLWNGRELVEGRDAEAELVLLRSGSPAGR